MSRSAAERAGGSPSPRMHAGGLSPHFDKLGTMVTLTKEF
jgi:hypothetical protein